MKELKYYLELPYTIILRKDEDGDFVARVDELRGCAAHGRTEALALANLREAQELWITDCIESGGPVPEPTVEEPLPSGKWVQRVPRSLHRKLVRAAKREGVSLNQLVTSILAEAMGTRVSLVEFKTGEPVAASAEIQPPDFHFWHGSYLGKWNIRQVTSPFSVFWAGPIVRMGNRLTWHLRSEHEAVLAAWLQAFGETEHAHEEEKEHRRVR